MFWKCASAGCSNPSLVDSPWCARCFAKLPPYAVKRMSAVTAMVPITRHTLAERAWSILSQEAPQLLGDLVAGARPRFGKQPVVPPVSSAEVEPPRAPAVLDDDE